jgi:C4-dicarboxylate transporter, DctM subunit
VHLGVVIVLTLMVGQITPPVGVTLYIVTDIAQIPMGRIVRATIPYLLAMIVAVAIVAYFPDVVLAIPRAFGYAG